MAVPSSIVAENKYGKYCIPTSSQHRFAAKKIINGDIWEPDTIEFIRNNCGEGTVIHAGTYFGDFLPGFDVCNKVLAYEPSLENFLCAQETIRLNGLTNIELVHSGLGDRVNNMGFVQTVDAANTSLGGAAKIVHARTNMCEQTKMTTIDEECRERELYDVSIIQLDIEGYEVNALKGAMGILRKCKPILILEVWNKKVLSENVFYKDVIFEELGYTFSCDIHDNVVLV